MVGTDVLEQRLLVLMAFLKAESSLLKSASMSLALQQLVRDMNNDTWFSLERSSKITGMFGGCRPVEPIADLVFVFMFGEVLKEVRIVLMNTENGWMLASDESHFVEARAREHTAQENEEAYADDSVYFLPEMNSRRKSCWSGAQNRGAIQAHGLNVYAKWSDGP